VAACGLYPRWHVTGTKLVPYVELNIGVLLRVPKSMQKVIWTKLFTFTVILSLSASSVEASHTPEVNLGLRTKPRPMRKIYFEMA